MKLYLIGSLRNPEVPQIGNELRSQGFDTFDEWFAAGAEADDYWRDYEQNRGHTLKQALNGYACWHVFSFDKHHLDTADIGVLVLPAGRSGHLELGYLIGQGKPGFILMEGEPDRYDVMYRFATQVFFNKDEMYRELKELI